jgi:plastocyanin
VSRVLRSLRLVAPIAVVFALLSQTGAYAATVSVSMTSNLRFSPDPAKAKLGDTIKWTNTSTATHTSTQDSPLSLWDSGSVPAGGTFSFTITAAGLYPYHCTFHQSLGMVGTAGARDIVTPPFGPIGTQFTVKVATVTAPAGFVYDIQKANPGGGFTDWMTNVTSVSKVWDSTGQAAGTYKFRSRLRNTSTGAASGYSPGFSIQIR